MILQILADENIPRLMVEKLRGNGHDVGYIAETAKADSDLDILNHAVNTNRVLLTQDQDFGDLVFRDGVIPPSVILLQLEKLSNLAKAERVAKVLREHGAELEGALTVIEPARIRIRRLTPG